MERFYLISHYRISTQVQAIYGKSCFEKLRVGVIRTLLAISKSYPRNQREELDDWINKNLDQLIEADLNADRPLLTEAELDYRSRKELGYHRIDLAQLADKILTNDK
jgi:hypothetical protein